MQTDRLRVQTDRLRVQTDSQPELNERLSDRQIYPPTTDAVWVGTSWQRVHRRQGESRGI